jgi:hypothetical protein
MNPKNDQVIYPDYMRSKSGFILRFCIVPTCLVMPFLLLLLFDYGAPTWVLVVSVPAMLGFGALIGLIFWAILGPALSAGKSFLFHTHPNAPKQDQEK